MAVGAGVPRVLLAVEQADPLGDAATTQRAVLQSVAAHLTAAHVTTGQEDDLRLERERQGSDGSYLSPD